MTKRLITSALAIVVLLQAATGWASNTFFWSLESGSAAALDGTADHTAGDNSPTAGANTPTLDATGAMAGSYGLSGTAWSYRFTPTSIISPTAGSVGFLIRWQQFNATATHEYFYARANLSSNTYIRIVGANTDELSMQIRDNPGAVQSITTTAANLQLNTTYFVTFSWDSAAPARRLCVYNSSGTLVEACTVDTSAFTPPAAIDGGNNLYFGDSQGGTGVQFYMDNMMVGSTYADADTFLCNFNITSYASYAACPAGGSTVSLRRRIQ